MRYFPFITRFKVSIKRTAGINVLSNIRRLSRGFTTVCYRVLFDTFNFWLPAYFFIVAFFSRTNTMALWKCIALLCPFLFLSQVCSAPTKCAMRRDLLKTTHSLLESMGGLFPRECLEENVKITFPKSALQSTGSNQKIGAAKAAYKVMEHIDYLFANDTHPESWNQRKVEDFQNLVFRLVNDYQCIMERTQRALDDFPTREDALKTYFDKLATLLRNKDYSACAWEVVRKELLHLLKFTAQLKLFT
ncbi:interferon phi 2 [Puntigrus tetrazona]|uniref:interferon phi 2 n=1 Tax=Puntigrus tetrazona TaxID=1606681 RepID=UPI001C8A1CD4|nr:interferon phi 2 [Puntigrus tetrazona]